MNVSEKQKKEIARLAQANDLELVLLFGSQVSGTVHKGSDVDIAVQFQDMDSAQERFFDLLADIQDVFPGQDIDLGLINGADPLFLKKILEDCDQLFGEPRALAELRMYAFRRYIDHKRYLKMEKDYIDRLLDRHGKGAA